MSKRELLFVTYRDGNLDEGLSYTIELAKAMYEDIVLLLVQKKDTLSKKFENLMAGVTFAEAGEHDTAQEMAAGSALADSFDHSAQITELVLKCSKAGVHLDVQSTEQDVVTSIRTYLKQNEGIDKVVLSPSVTESEVLTTRDLNRLVRTASRPIVTMTRQSVRAAREVPVQASESSHRDRGNKDTKTSLEKEYA
jgi:hypothetical protein